MRATEVGAVWGVGRKTGARLNEAGIRSVLDLLQADVATLRRQFGVVLEKTILELRGTPCLQVDDAPAANQQIMCSRSFGQPVTDLASLQEAVSLFAARVTEKLRQQGSVARAVHVFFHTSPYRKHDRQHSPAATLPLVRPTADTRQVIAAALRAVESVFRPGFNYVKAGVMLTDLQPQGREQGELELFAEEAPSPQPQRRRDSLMTAVDALNQRFGRDAVTVASATRPQGRAAGRSAHASRQERRSPRYTTRLDEVVTARA
jgi:DNA polymerase V